MIVVDILYFALLAAIGYCELRYCFRYRKTMLAKGNLLSNGRTAIMFLLLIVLCILMGINSILGAIRALCLFAVSWVMPFVHHGFTREGALLNTLLIPWDKIHAYQIKRESYRIKVIVYTEHRKDTLSFSAENRENLEALLHEHLGEPTAAVE